MSTLSTTEVTGANNLIFSVLALAIIPAISVAVRQLGRFLRELSHRTQAAAAAAASIAEVQMSLRFLICETIFTTLKFYMRFLSYRNLLVLFEL